MQRKYCVYLTTYYGNKLPPFYIGHTFTYKITEGYRGSVCSKKYKSIWNEEVKKSPHLFKTIILVTFNTRKEAKDKELCWLQQLKVTRNDLYVNRAAFPHFDTESRRGKTNEEIFGKENAAKIAKKISSTLKKKYQSGELINPLKGKRLEYVSERNRIIKKNQPCKEETKRKISQALKGRSIKGHPAWNKGFSKNTDLRLADLSKALKGKPSSLKNIPKSQKHRENMKIAWIRRKQRDFT